MAASCCPAWWTWLPASPNPPMTTPPPPPRGAGGGGWGKTPHAPPRQAAAAAPFPAGRPPAQARRRGTDRDGRADRIGLRRLWPGRGAAGQHLGAATRAAIRRHL